MASASGFLCGSASKPKQEGEEDERSYQKHRDTVSSLPQDDRWAQLKKFQGFWYPEAPLVSTLAAREHFVARPCDVFLACSPKAGTTWLKSVAFSVLHRSRHSPRGEGHPLRATNPHDLVGSLMELYLTRKNPDLTSLPSPRLFAAHEHYSALPDSVKNTGCRVVYLTREPKDNFVSLWHFFLDSKFENVKTTVSMEDAFDLFCSGVSPWGPIWEHALEYWNAHLRRPDQVLFLRYEAMKEDPVGNLKKLAAFLGCPFSAEEEMQGVPEDISELCSFKTLSSLEVNKDGVVANLPVVLKKKLFFRRGEAGDWVNHLTPEMAEKLDKITQEKLQGSGLEF